ncbi:MAG TPA: hypothetical protein VHO48_11210 [Anaerolineaceae bacterium]|nr:hypothetical protein [Anaerolineaceae bacterium]
MSSTPETSAKLLIGLVGPCAAGKTTLQARLTQLGYESRHIAQEHSYVPYMWERITHPDVLIYLDVSYPVTIARRNLSWTIADYQEQLHRLRHAREHADFVVHTDALSPDEVARVVVDFLREKYGVIGRKA